MAIKDELFIRDNVPMTKEEIRSLSLSKMNLKRDSVVLDVGAGTGSISIEAALVCNKGYVYSIEKNIKGIELINKNANKFDVKNIHVINDIAPNGLDNINGVDSIFIGGSSSNMESIIKKSYDILKPNGRIVVNSILLETMYNTLQYLDKYSYKNIDIMQVSISKSRLLGGKIMLDPYNPIFIIWADKE